MASPKSGDAKPVSESLYRDADGNLCIGGECIRVKLPKDSGDPIEVDLSDCPDDVKKALGDSVMKGSPTAYDFRKTGKTGKTADQAKAKVEE